MGKKALGRAAATASALAPVEVDSQSRGGSCPTVHRKCLCTFGDFFTPRDLFVQQEK